MPSAEKQLIRWSRPGSMLWRSLPMPTQSRLHHRAEPRNTPATSAAMPCSRPPPVATPKETKNPTKASRVIGMVSDSRKEEAMAQRWEEGRGGQEGVSEGRGRGAQYGENKKH